MSLPYTWKLPDPASALPLVFDSPHSGTDLPLDMQCVAPPKALMSACDAFIDELWSGALAHGAALLAAHFHRTYIDLNRSRYDIDPVLLDQPWPGKLETSEKSKAGMGLIRRLALPGVPMYDRKLSVAEVQARLQDYYIPYHETLRERLDVLHARFGKVWHIDCHSMKSVGNAMNIDAGAPRPDFVVSDRNGSSADPQFTSWIAQQVRELGYSVKINDPYKGAELVSAYAAPAQQRHSIQIEINRRLYMDEERFTPNAGFFDLQDKLTQLSARIAGYVRAGI